MVCTGRKNAAKERPRAKVRKPLKRPALRGVVTAPVVVYDAGALSCLLFDPLIMASKRSKSPPWGLTRRGMVGAEHGAGKR